MSDKRYYWLKLQKDFFKRNDIQVVEPMPQQIGLTQPF